MDEIGQEIHRGLPREGPGDAQSTLQALSMLSNLPGHPSILDVGSGPGMQTLEIAKACDGTIAALDTNQDFLNELEQRAQEAGLSQKIKTVPGSMFSLPFENESFDLIWAEGAIYIIGFEDGLREWKKYLKRNGYMAATHISWLKSDIPDEPKKFWGGAYPMGVRQIKDNLEIASKIGYKEIGHFTLPESAWWNDYYTPLEKRLSLLREKYAAHSAQLERIEETQQEIDLYRKYPDYYGYVFYILQRD